MHRERVLKRDHSFLLDSIYSLPLYNDHHMQSLVGSMNKDFVLLC